MGYSADGMRLRESLAAWVSCADAKGSRSIDLTHTSTQHRRHDPSQGSDQESVDVGINHITARLCGVQ